MLRYRFQTSPFSLSTIIFFEMDPSSKHVFKTLRFLKAVSSNFSVFHCISVGGRQKCIQMHAFPYESVLMWTPH